MGNRDAIAAKVQQMLVANFNGVTLTADGGFSLRFGSARAFIRVVNTGDEPDALTFVGITIPTLIGVNAGTDLYEYVAYHSDDFRLGHLSVYRQKDDSVDLFVTHQILGDYLDEEELRVAVSWVAASADRIDDELQTKFGGQRFHED